MKIFEEGFYKRNKKVILIAVMIMLISALAGAGIAFLNADGQYNKISSMIKSHTSDTGSDNVDLGIDAVELFIHNLTADCITVLGGFLFSIISVLIVVFNGVSIGAPFGIDFPFAAPSILPHGIIEYFAGALALAVAFKITRLEINVIKNRNLRDTLKEHEIDIRDTFSIVVVMVILLAVAAVIEAYITPMICNWYFGF